MTSGETPTATLDGAEVADNRQRSARGGVRLHDVGNHFRESQHLRVTNNDSTCIRIRQPLLSVVDRLFAPETGETTRKNATTNTYLRISVSVWISGSMVSKDSSDGLQVIESFTSLPWMKNGCGFRSSVSIFFISH